jgi:hypothetical protein
LDVWQVDPDYAFTGYKYAETPSTGRVVIRNPHFSTEQLVDINSSDYKNPTSNNPTRPNLVFKPTIAPIICLLLN